MTTLNVDKMRHTIVRSKALATERESHAWLAAMTPEHRAWHEDPNPKPFSRLSGCPTCWTETFAQIARVGHSIAQTSAPR